ncbi:MAG: multiheme c-type cytochrome [bacterium JZ-2024 1]
MRRPTINERQGGSARANAMVTAGAFPRALILAGTILVFGPMAHFSLGQEGAEWTRCEGCHPEETAQWKASPHAQAIGDTFLGVWQERRQEWECLVCHTSTYDRLAGTFSRDGVSCESCHGTPPANHPAEGQMILPVSSDVCRSCHTVTHAEWRISAHGQKNIRCFDCHKMHRMELRKDDPDQMCGTCHSKRLKDFAHATHRIRNLHCISCHMTEPVDVRVKIMGTGVRSHTFSVSAQTCAGCHQEMVHESHEIASLEQEVQRLRQLTPTELVTKVEELEKTVTSQREMIQANRRLYPWIVVITFVLGGLLGATVAGVPVRRRRHPDRGDANNGGE